ncbi:MAG: hypothetical protein JO093_05455 [Acidobacteria bacterium]|nr:hypothetical protein [Acidobacteriota bacterium]MBV9068275.1 hypothetical protein [Acidobacteriota bacterium]MBV9185043.1 hypothetical protein [Acidobacteriota bacterium]
MRRMMAAAMVLLVSAALPVRAERRRSAAPPEQALSIVFVEAGPGDASLKAAGSEAWLDLNAVNHQGNSRSTRLRRTFGIRIERAGNATAGTAAIVARLESWDGRATYRLDGRPLTAAPFIVDAHAAVGTVTVHTLDIEIPIEAAAGPLAASIAWEVNSN